MGNELQKEVNIKGGPFIFFFFYTPEFYFYIVKMKQALIFVQKGKKKKEKNLRVYSEKKFSLMRSYATGINALHQPRMFVD